jgi:hypothetical protein
MVVGAWHKSVQDKLADNMVERRIRSCDSEIKGGKVRIADILIGNCVIEVQHSKIALTEVTNRHEHYTNAGMSIVWLIHLSEGELVREKSRCLIKIAVKSWKIAALRIYDVVYYGDDTHVYKINLAELANKGSAVPAAIMSYNEFFCSFKDESITATIMSAEFDWDRPSLQEYKFYCVNCGAGTGKTYRAVNYMLDGKITNNTCTVDKACTFTDKTMTTFIYLTKTHGAKDIILQEFNRRDITIYTEIEICATTVHNNGSGGLFNTAGKQYYLEFERCGHKCVAIIGTFDSFTYALAKDKNIVSIDLFGDLENDIIKYGIAAGPYGTIVYAGFPIKLASQTLIITDESQDLSANKFTMLNTLCSKTGVTVCMIGDILQSVYCEDNALFHAIQAAEHVESSSIIMHEKNNDNRRFARIDHIKFCAGLINYDAWDVPKPKFCYSGQAVDELFPGVQILEGHSFSLNALFKADKAEELVQPVLAALALEVELYGYGPSDVLVIFPFISNNTLAQLLNAKINKFWADKFGRSDIYSYIHKSTAGTAIDLKYTADKTRIVTIHTSKGDGRKLVFALGLNDCAFKMFTPTRGLMYESLLHVAVTRQVNKLYLGVCSDYLGRRIMKEIAPELLKLPDFNYRVSKNHLSSAFSKQWRQLGLDYELPSLLVRDSVNQTVVDFNHHIMRWSALIMKTYLFAIGHDENRRKRENALIKGGNKYSDIRVAHIVSLASLEVIPFNTALCGRVSKYDAETVFDRLRPSGKPLNIRCCYFHNVKHNYYGHKREFARIAAFCRSDESDTDSAVLLGLVEQLQFKKDALKLCCYKNEQFYKMSPSELEARVRNPCCLSHFREITRCVPLINDGVTFEKLAAIINVVKRKLTNYKFNICEGNFHEIFCHLEIVVITYMNHIYCHREYSRIWYHDLKNLIEFLEHYEFSEIDCKNCLQILDIAADKPSGSGEFYSHINSINSMLAAFKDVFMECFDCSEADYCGIKFKTRASYHNINFENCVFSIKDKVMMLEYQGTLINVVHATNLTALNCCEVIVQIIIEHYLISLYNEQNGDKCCLNDKYDTCILSLNHDRPIFLRIAGYYERNVLDAFMLKFVMDKLRDFNEEIVLCYDMPDYKEQFKKKYMGQVDNSSGNLISNYFNLGTAALMSYMPLLMNKADLQTLNKCVANIFMRDKKN